MADNDTDEKCPDCKRPFFVFERDNGKRDAKPENFCWRRYPRGTRDEATAVVACLRATIAARDAEVERLRAEAHAVDWRQRAIDAEAKLEMATRFDLDGWPNGNRVVARRRDGRWNAGVHGGSGPVLDADGYATLDDAWRAATAKLATTEDTE